VFGGCCVLVGRNAVSVALRVEVGLGGSAVANGAVVAVTAAVGLGVLVSVGDGVVVAVDVAVNVGVSLGTTA
jgi:hypothetical protein